MLKRSSTNEYHIWVLLSFNERFVRFLYCTYLSVTHPLPVRQYSLAGRSFLLLVRYLCVTHAFMPSLHLPRRPSSPPRRLSPLDKHFFAFCLSVRYRYPLYVTAPLSEQCFFYVLHTKEHSLSIKMIGFPSFSRQKQTDIHALRF